MMRTIDKVLKARSENRRSILVPEWDETLYFSPLTTNDMISVADRMQDEGKEASKNELERRVVLLIQKAELEDGSNAFEWGDRITLMESAEWDVLQRVIAFMYRSAMTAHSEEEAKKKSERTEDSDSG